MNMTRVLSTAMLCLLPGAIATAYAQEHEEKPAEHQQAAKPAKQPAAHQQAAKPAKQQAARQTAAKKATPAKQQAARQPAAKEAKPAKQQAAREQQAKPGKQEQSGRQEQASRGNAAGGHGSIPEARYNASFGSGHTFHVNRSNFANGSGRFQYGGYWFNAANPWPVGWLYTDSVYVAYLNGGYFLCDPVHPGVYLSINVAI
jgi:hypothetical protein